MILRLLRVVLVTITVAVSIPYTVAIVNNLLSGWPQRKDKYARALHPRKVFALNHVWFQRLRDKPKLIFLLLKWKQFYRNADPKDFIKNIPYGRNGHFLDVHRATHSVNKTSPVIVFIYGGTWSSGEKDMYGLLSHQLVCQTNCVTICPNYSTYPTGHVDDMLQDVVDTLFWVKENIEQYGGDSNNIVLMGHSAGAHLCALAILELLRNERISVASSFKFDQMGESLDELAFAESHYGQLSKLGKWREGSEDSSSSSESFAVVSENGSMADNGGNELDGSTASTLGFLSGSVNSQGMDSSLSSEGFVKTDGSESQEAEVEEDSGIASAAETLGGGDQPRKAQSQEPGDSGTTSSAVSQTESGSMGDDEEEVDDDSGDNDSIVTVRPQDLDRLFSLSDLSKSIKAFIGLGGVYSIGDHFQHESMRGIEDVSYMARAFYGEDHFDRFSPVEILQRVGQTLSLPKIVLVHGTADYHVPTSSSTKFAEVLAKISANVKLRLIPECPHYDVCLDLMDTERKYHSHVMNIILETLNGIS